MTALTARGPIKCAASTTRLSPPWDRFRVDRRCVHEGDVVLLEVSGSHGVYAEVENSAGRSEALHRGDLFLGVLANRESSFYLNGHVPTEGIDLMVDDELHLLSNGLVGRCDESPDYLGRPLALRCYGVLLEEDDGPVNTIRRPLVNGAGPFAPLLLVAARPTDAGKTTLAATLIAALTRDYNLRVAGTKLAGTGCLEDVLLHQDAGAQWVADFPDAGLPSTYTASENYEPAVRALLGHLSGKGPDLIVSELGGDLIWANIPTLLRMPDVAAAVMRLVVIPGDVLAAVGTRHVLDDWGVTLPVTWVTPANRNHRSFAARMQQYAPGPLISARDGHAIQRLADQLAHQLHERPRTVVPA